MGLLQKLTGRRRHPADASGAPAHWPENSPQADSKNTGRHASGGWFSLFAGKALAGPDAASGPLPDLSEALRSHRRKTRHEWLDSAPIQTELLNAFNDVFDETMTDGLGLADAAPPDNLLAVTPPAFPSPAIQSPAIQSPDVQSPAVQAPVVTPSLGADPADQPTQADDGEMPDGFTMLFRAHG